ncbi:uncharacterized protein LOC124373473 [Homalodisca vitripennis]|uniref:uncharacterized protein LOC124366793 n=1 Tax=Homalodisca vitripennis TaxID=197043 RepID=UPI001EE9B7A7|nr:uncharacterized protein LOC124366793 [Homalodisca vitripennis]XP_046687801.1 uncharacterized protein LOC124373473 [Homalodisca vitripennis]
MSKADIECISVDGLVWRCQACAQTRRKSMRFDSEMTEGKLTLEDVMKKVTEIFENQKQAEKNVNTSYEALSDKLEDNTKAVKEQTASLEKCLRMIDELAAENRSLREKVSSLEMRIDDLEQYSRVNSVEIHGIPQQKNEDVVAVVKEVGKALDLEITDSMIDNCHRLGRRPGPNSPQPGIVVKFVRRLDKEELLRKRRVKSNFSTRHMNLSMDQPIYINEALSQARRRLLAAARQVKKEKSFKYLWVRGGKIFLRKEEKAPVFQVTCQADLDRF